MFEKTVFLWHLKALGRVHVGVFTMKCHCKRRIAVGWLPHSGNLPRDQLS